ncbi:MAG: DNA polymerase I [Alphaproteobacteria bacterium]|nr:DNA polymerase I [Alphaproteobacteria bacterium]MCB9696563.1 DNA polymerase I [Alphaproteobacteria bacterium]
MPKKLFLVDGSNHAFRVQYALPPQHASDGFPTRVLYGFTLLFQKMMRTYRPDWCVVSFDTGKSFRNTVYSEYKGHRREMPEDMKRQWPFLKPLVEGFGYAVNQAEGYEADDVLGTLALKYASEDVDVYIVTGDKDFGQLVNDHIFLVDDAKGQILRAPDVVEKLGVPPEQVIDALALSGDSSDNIPGVPGVGLKTAAKLLEDFGDLEGVLSAAAEGKIKGKRGEMLVEHAENARLSKVLATIATDVPLEGAIEDFAPRGVQEEPLRELFDRWEFMEVANKLLPAKVMVNTDHYRVVTEPDDLDALLASLRKAGRFGVALRTTSDRVETCELLGCGFAIGDEVAYVPLVPRHDVHVDPTEARAKVIEVLADPSLQKVGFDLKRDLRVLRRLGGDLPGIAGDIKLLDYVLVAHRRTHGLAEIAKRHLGHNIAYEPGAEPLMVGELARIGGEPAHLAVLLHDRLASRLDDESTRKVYETIEMPLLPVLADMEEAGITLDLTVMDGIFRDVAERVEAAEKRCHEILGRPFKVGSPKEVGEILFDELKLTKQKRTKTGYSTDAGVLEKLVDEHDLPQAILDWRSLQKLESTYLRTLPGFVAADGRIHTTFNQAVAATGRLSSTDPNLQNIPVRTFEGRRIRDGFVAAEGHSLISADYSQVELRVLAHCCGGGALVESFTKGEDIHRRTASEVWKLPMEEVSYEQRSAAKAINFGLLYGMSAFRLGRDLAISREQAQQYMDDYFGRIPQVSEWIAATKQLCRERGYVETLFGRRRLIPEIYSKDYQERMAAEREAVNSVVQGTAADLIKIAMIRVHGALKEGGYAARLLLQVHDELLLEAPEDEVDAIKTLVREQMMSAAELLVPLDVDVGAGHNWNQAKGE